MKAAWTAILIVLCAWAPARAESREARDLLARGVEALNEWRLADAHAALERLGALKDAMPAALLDGRIAFIEGRYGDARAAAERAIALAGGTRSRDLEEFRDYAARLEANTRRFAERESAHFRLRYEPGPDEVIVAPALEALEAAYARVGEDLGWLPEEKVLVEVLPTRSSFVDASTLSRDEVETSGTIAVCKFRRIMMMSPRLTAQGFPYLDKLTHEYVHYVITAKTRNRVPVWLHEGVAFYEETRWRAEHGGFLQPSLRALLADATERGEWIGIDAMSPSIAKLPSQREASLAFAQVIMAVDWLVRRGGYPLLREILDRIGAGETDRAAFVGALGGSFADFERHWRAHIGEQPWRLDRKLQLLTLRVREDGPDEEEGDGSLREIDSEGARRFARLGDLLREKGRAKAASMEYRKASEAADALTPVIEVKLARALMADGRTEEAAPVLEELVRYYPFYPTAHVALGEVWAGRNAWEEARAAFEQAAAINAFDPTVHVRLAEAYAALGRPEDEARAAGKARLLADYYEGRAARAGAGGEK